MAEIIPIEPGQVILVREIAETLAAQAAIGRLVS